MEEKVNENTTKEPKSNNVLKVILLTILAAIIFAGGFYAGKTALGDNNNSNNDKEEQKEEQNNKTNDEEKEKEAQEFIDSYIKVALYSSDGGNSVYDAYIKGCTADSLTQNDKIVFTLISLISINNKNIEVNEAPEKYKDQADYFKGATITELSIETFKNEYKKYFKSDIDVNAETMNNEKIGFCPFPYIVDNELGKIYLSDQCGGTGYPTVTYKTLETSKDDNYYYTKVSVEESGYSYVEGKEFDNKTTLLWKFDKNLNFVSTEVVE